MRTLNSDAGLDLVTGWTNLDIITAAKNHIKGTQGSLAEDDFQCIAVTCGLSRQQIVPFIAEAQIQLKKQSEYAGKKAIEAAQKFAEEAADTIAKNAKASSTFNPDSVWIPLTPEQYFGEQPGHGGQY